MKKTFFDSIIEAMNGNKDIYFISIGLGWPRTDDLKDNFPDRFIQTEASEQTALDIAVGLAYGGKIVFVYTITPFFLRGFETIRTYIDHEKLNIKLIGAGRDDDYSKDDGFSHDATDIKSFLTPLVNIKQYSPIDETVIPQLVTSVVNEDRPCFISLRR